MESMIGYYVLFALTTSIVSIYEIIGPVMRQLAANNPEDMMIKSKYLSYFVFFILGLVFAPLLIIACLVPSVGDRMRVSLLTALEG